MRILILGAGVIGVTSAWYLRQQGHDVVNLEDGMVAWADAGRWPGGRRCGRFGGA